MPSIDAWLQCAATDAERRADAGVKPVLDGIAGALTQLRKASWNADAADPRTPPTPTDETRPRG